jgi:hypothetical protein
MGRLVVSLHMKYCSPDLVPVVWLILVATSILQVILVASAR